MTIMEQQAEPLAIIKSTWVHDGTGSDCGPTNGVLLWPGETDEGHEILPAPGTVVDAVFRERGQPDRPVRVEITGIRVVLDGVIALLPHSDEAGDLQWADPETARAAWAEWHANGGAPEPEPWPKGKPRPLP